MNPDIKLAKVFTEIRLSPSLLYSDVERLNKLANQFREDLNFEDINYNKRGVLEIKSISKKTLISFYNNRIVIDNDDPGYDFFESTTKKAVGLYSQIFDVKIFNRSGFRFHWGLKFSSFDEAKKSMFKTFFNILQDSQPLINIGTVQTGKVSLSCIDQDKKYNLEIFPVSIQNIEVKGGITPEPSVSQSILDVIMFDLDLYKDNKIKVDDYCKLLGEAHSYSQTKVYNFLEIFGIRS